MYEVEVKVRADHDAVRERLAELGARSLGTVAQVDTYFDAPHRDFAETDEALRVRQVTTADESDSDAETRVTYKGPLVESASKTREEVEVGVAAAEPMEEILARLGFERAATVRKVRERYALDDYVVALDDVADLGAFVEVETEADEGDVERAREGAFGVLERLGLDPDAGIRTSYLGLLLSGEKGG